jgi:imidazolonepropionase-like amidohydrolase
MTAIARIAGLLLLCNLVGFGTTNTPRTYELRGGSWWNGTAFVSRTIYSVDGVFEDRRPARVDSVIDLSGSFVVPPFGESHTHTIAYVRSRIDEFLADGVFYALVMNVHRKSIGESFTWFNRPRSVDVSFTTMGVTASDGHPIQIGMRGDETLEDVDGDWITIVETPDDIERKWPALQDANPDLIKLFLLYSDRYAERHGDTTIASRYKGMDPALVPTLVARAHDAGLRVAAHVRTARDFQVAVEAGVDIIAHLPGFSMGPASLPDFENPERLADIEHPEWFRLRPEDVALAAAQGITVIPTIGELGEVPDGLPAGVAETLTRLIDVRTEVITANLRLLRDHGVRIAIGSDAGEGSPVTEALAMDQLRIFTRGELLRALTEEAARLTFPRRSVGRLEPGYEASFLALGGDPLQGLEHIRDIRLRFKQGTPLILEGGSD